MKFTVEHIAETAHEVNRAYCEALGDFSQAAWADAPEWQRASCTNGVKHHMANPGSTPRASHEVWLEEKRATGWKFGPVKNAETKEHPCFLPFDELKESDRAKDHLFRAVVRLLAPFVLAGQ